MSEMPRSPNGWERWQEHVLAEQRRMNDVLIMLVRELGIVVRDVAVLLETKAQVADLTRVINEKLVPNQRELFVRVGVLASGISIGLSTVISLAIWFFTSRP